MAASAQPAVTRSPQVAMYERLVKMMEHELELAGQGRVLELRAAVAERSKYLRSLPRPVSSEVEPLLLRARALHSRVSIEAQRLSDSLVRRREARRLARRMARTYVPPPRTRNYSTSA